MNFANMMQQAQKMQKKLQDAQAELAALDIDGEAGNGSVKVVVNGQGKFKSIKLAPEAINPENPSAVDTDTIEMLEDLIAQAMNQATEKAQEKSEAAMKNITGGIKIPGLI
ncbi:MAG: YbaB/EbfC family nucleoid-associated protein [Candidatus Gastranaerophilales bacterium]|nr:YbaB/EbfC family nucleoid-associated protein [Candidatus Gastranaerophilales bacterium]